MKERLQTEREVPGRLEKALSRVCLVSEALGRQRETSQVGMSWEDLLPTLYWWEPQWQAGAPFLGGPDTGQIKMCAYPFSINRWSFQNLF